MRGSSSRQPRRRPPVVPPRGLWDEPDAGRIAVPARPGSPAVAIARRLVAALALLVLVTLLVWLGRNGYNDNGDPNPDRNAQPTGAAAGGGTKAEPDSPLRSARRQQFRPACLAS
jgi:hypothetical protein